MHELARYAIAYLLWTAIWFWGVFAVTALVILVLTRASLTSVTIRTPRWSVEAGVRHGRQDDR